VSIKAVLTDIEGTTSSISFVKDVLFPYAAEHLDGFVKSHLQHPDVQQALRDTAQLCGKNPDDVDTLLNQLQDWLREDKKITPLKNLQGLIWQAGYEEGHYQAHMYEDATECLRAWHAQGLPLYIYSSGSVYAQKLFFANTVDGDLLPLFSSHFDTTTGSKQEKTSYEKISRALHLEPHEIVFLSDIEAELDAAKAAGMQTYWLVRDTSTSIAHAQHRAVRDFYHIQVN
jgi:enolase-phosphatase E1